MSDLFGNTDSKKMPEHFFDGALALDHQSAIRANVAVQKYCVAPRHWYIDADFKCGSCGQEFTWSAREQKVWFEDYCMWVDAQPWQCKSCISDQRHLAKLQSEYDSGVASAREHGSIEEKERIIQIISELTKSFRKLPDKMIDTKELFERQIKKRAEQDGAD